MSEYTKIDNVQDINWNSKEEVKSIKWDDLKVNPFYNMHNIWIAHNLANHDFTIFMDEPILEEDGIWRSAGGCWAKLDVNWWPLIAQGECKHYKLFEELIRKEQ